MGSARLSIPSPERVEAGGTEVQGHLLSHSEFKACLTFYCCNERYTVTKIQVGEEKVYLAFTSILKEARTETQTGQERGGRS